MTAASFLADRLAEIDMTGTGWMDRALCAEVDPELHFPERGDPLGPARRVCLACEVKAECLAYALRIEEGLSREMRHGIYGAASPGQRWEMARERQGRRAA